MNVSNHGFPVTFGAASGLMMLIGASQLYRVIRDYSPSTEGENPRSPTG